MPVMRFNVTDELADALRADAQRRGVSVSDLLRSIAAKAVKNPKLAEYAKPGRRWPNNDKEE